MHHGITQSNGMIASHRATKVRKHSLQTIAKTINLLEEYEVGEELFKYRLAKLEQQDLQRQAKEVNYAEELANNHGKPLSFF